MYSANEVGTPSRTRDNFWIGFETESKARLWSHDEM